MTTTYGSQTSIVWGKNVSITAGGNTYAECEQATIHKQYKVLEEEVASTFIPAMGTGVFHGDVELDMLYSTDIDFIALTTPGASGDLPTTTITMVLKDTAGSPTTKTLTCYARLNDVEHAWKKGNFVTARVKGVLTADYTT